MTSIRVLPPGAGKIVGRILVKHFNEIALIEWTKKNESAEEQFSTAIFIEMSYFERVRLVKYHNTRITFIDKCLRGMKNFPATFLLGLLVRHLHSISIEKYVTLYNNHVAFSSKWQTRNNNQRNSAHTG